MKRSILGLTLALVMGGAQAELNPYVGLYGINTSTFSTSGNETAALKQQVVAILGLKTQGTLSFGAELSLQGNTAGINLAAHKRLGSFTVSLGKTFPGEVSYGTTNYGEVESHSTGEGAYISISYKNLSLRFVEYNINHTYTGSKKFPHPTIAGKTITKTSSTSSSALRRQVWLGVQVGF